MNKFAWVAAACLAWIPLGVHAGELNVRAIKQHLIAKSIAQYPGNCPCPYSQAANGSRCGKRSAYSKPGGYALLCYEQDILDEMVAGYKQAHKR